MQNNNMAKNVILPNPSVAAIAPINVGKAPGIAPINTEKGVTLFKGVYTNAYKTIDKNPIMPLNGFVNTHNKIVPITPK